MRAPLRLVCSTLAVLALLATACSDDDSTTTATTTTAAPTSTPTSTSTSTSTTTTTTTLPAPTIPAPEASTVDDLFALDRAIVIGHAGGDQSWPKTTMFAFREAALAGTDVLEMDVQLTGDGVLIALHDDTVDGTTGASGRVRDLTYDEIQALDQAYWWSDDWADRSRPDEDYVWRGVRTGEIDPPPGYTADDFRIETFRAIAEAFPDHVLDVELKLPRGDDGAPDVDFAIEAARVLADEIDALDRADSVVVVSFSDEVIEAFHEFAPGVATSPASAAMTSWFLEGVPLLESHQVLQVPPFNDGLDILNLPGFLEKASDEGLEVWVWPNDASTQENPDFYEELLGYDIDGLLVGHPDLAVERLREIGAIA